MLSILKHKEKNVKSVEILSEKGFRVGNLLEKEKSLKNLLTFRSKPYMI
jgi:hypothetical protein